MKIKNRKELFGMSFTMKDFPSFEILIVDVDDYKYAKCLSAQIEFIKKTVWKIEYPYILIPYKHIEEEFVKSAKSL